MGITMILAGSNDNDVDGIDSSYATARALTTGDLLGDPVGVEIYVGQLLTAVYNIWQGFSEFAYTVNTDNLNVAAYFGYSKSSRGGTVARNVEVRTFDWGGGAVALDDYVEGTALNGLVNLAGFNSQQAVVTGRFRGGAPALLQRLENAGPIRIMLHSSRNRTGNAPTGDETDGFYSTDQSGTSSDPSLTILTTRRSTLSWVQPGARQLSDGSTVYLESDGAAVPVITLKHYNPLTGAVVTVGVVPTGTSTTTQFGMAPGLQALCLVVDALDNLYVIGPNGYAAGGYPTDICAKAYAKGSGYTWTAKTLIKQTLPSDAASPGMWNNFGAAWHPTSGSGHIFVVATKSAWTEDVSQFATANLSCAAMLAGSGTLLTASGNSVLFLGLSTPTDPVDYPNPSGTSLDISAVPGSNSGFVVTRDRDGLTTCGKYTLAVAGTVASSAGFAGAGFTNTGDANAKLRAIPITDVKYVLSSGEGVAVYNSTGSLLGSATLPGTAANFPTATAMRASQSWDAIYDPVTDKIWVYYLDSVDSRILRRTAVSMSTYAATGESIIVNSTIGVTGTTNLGIRAPRGRVFERSIRLAVANLNGTTLSTVYVDDSLNIAPNAPILTTKANFNATLAATFNWTFSDPNTGDTQTAYELEIDNNTTGVSAFRSNKVTSSTASHALAANGIANGVTYRWRVRTYDKSDAAGAWAAYGTFTTAATGVVTITDPTTDNATPFPKTDDYTVVWTVTGSDQASYRVRLIRTSDSAVISDTGFVTNSVLRQLNVTGMASNIEYMLEVSTKNAATLLSTIATRLITVDWSSPETPILTLLPGDGYIEAAISNPPPAGDNPDVLYNMLYRRVAGTDTWLHIANVDPSGSYRDYTAVSLAAYEYRAEGVGEFGGNASSLTTAVTAPVLEGIWLHDPRDPMGTARNLRYNAGSGRAQQRTVESATFQFAGRQYPVTDFGETETDKLTASVMIPFDENWAGLVAYVNTLPQVRSALCYRDNRGRVMYVTTAEVNGTDDKAGTVFSLEFQRISYTEGV